MSEHRATATTALVNPQGLHARPSALIVKTANAFDAVVTLTIDDRTADCRSIMEVMMLASPVGTPLAFEAVGPQAEEAVAALVRLVSSGFGESPA